MNILAYFMLATEIIGAVGAIRVLLATNTLTGPTLYADIQPALVTLQQLNNKVAVPTELAQALCEVIADTVNSFFHPKAKLAVK